MDKLKEIPSEFIEPYLVNFLSEHIFAIGHELETPEQARISLKEVDRFVSQYCGIHARIGTSNKYREFINLDNKEMIDICKEAVNK